MDAIEADPFISRRDTDALNIAVSDGIVRLSGTVQDRRAKPLAYADAF